MRPKLACDCGAYFTLRADHVGPTVACEECAEVLIGTQRFRRRWQDAATRVKDPWSLITHLAGLVFAVVASIVLVSLAASRASSWHVVAFAIYGASLIQVYVASCLYHWLDLSRRGNRMLRRLDAMAIFVMIAGCYTPLCLVPLRGVWGWSLLVAIWGLALVGWCMALLWLHPPRWVWAAVYVGMGSLALVAIGPLVQVFSWGGLWWFFLGGASYALGALLWAYRWPNPTPAFAYHEVFHLFVLGGSVSHYIMMHSYVLEMA